MKKLTIKQIEKFYYELKAAEVPQGDARRYKNSTPDYLSLLHREMEDRNMKSLTIKETEDGSSNG